MSYRADWGRLKASEKRLGVKLVEMQTHGEGSSLTAAAKDLLHKFDQLEKEPCTFLEERGRKLLLIRPDEASGQTNEKIIRKLCGWINAAFIYTQSLHLLSHAIEYI
jgi:molybdenum-dependent DNA-binding transcriptional regulator ModE